MCQTLIPQKELYQLATSMAENIPFHTREIAPISFAQLKDCVNGELCVWSGGSGQTIYGLPYGNYCFRAWHDTIHLALNCDFALGSVTKQLGEYWVAREQCRIASFASAKLADWMWSDMRGQEDYYLEHGYFPNDQIPVTTQFYKENFA